MPKSAGLTTPLPPKPVRRLAIAVVLVLGLSASAEPAMAQPTGGQETVVRLTGSNMIADKAIPEIAAAWAKQLKLLRVRVVRGADPDEYEVLADDARSTRRLRVQVRAKGTNTGLEPLLRGQSDLWMASRAARESDIEAMRKADVPKVPSLAQLQKPGVENLIGLNALVVVVNPRNPVPMLTNAQIQRIFIGKSTAWAQVGGPSNTPIGLYGLKGNRDETDAFCGTFMGMSDAPKCLNSFGRLVAPLMAVPTELVDAVVGNLAGIGFVGAAVRGGARAVPLSSGCGTGIEPTAFRIKAGEYPAIQRLYLYTAPGRAPSPAVRDFLQFALGPLGQAAVEAAGLADLSPAKADGTYRADRLKAARDAMDGGKTPVAPTDASAFEAGIANAERLSTTFRFQAGTKKLDGPPDADIGRIGALMRQPANSRTELIVIGYSGINGDHGENPALAKERADLIRDRLRTAGVRTVTSVGAGSAAAIVCNLDPNTAPLNYRVEVWQRARN
jgi:phosphate transport system substrate-binding protein